MMIKCDDEIVNILVKLKILYFTYSLKRLKDFLSVLAITKTKLFNDVY